ncbi:Low-density lipo receptor-related 2 [Brachionus plicatilis]|uniref:Low-density lipo receptor-related 2 n=1 Tax=Brachionus plicatilis TaxID=10195 RepID=A0A3M7RGV4_BRAPC|nr:Low-density lipo receptor-related 2 [Brachionus plicatilis]
MSFIYSQGLRDEGGIYIRFNEEIEHKQRQYEILVQKLHLYCSSNSRCGQFILGGDSMQLKHIFHITFMCNAKFYVKECPKANVTNPRGVVLDPRSEHRLIFWTDWGKYPRIERASMDGTNRTVLISTKLYWPNGLAIDMVRERIYFADAHLDYIESCDYNGNNRVQVISNDLMLHHPHSLAFFEHNIFWLDRGHNKVLKLDRLSPKNKTTIADISSRALTVKVVHELLQPQEQNPCLTSNCEHLCLLAKNQQGFTCECQIGYLKDPINKNRCNIDQSEFLLVLNKNMIGGIKINSNDTLQPELSTPAPLSPLFAAQDTHFSNLERESGFLWDRMVTINDIKSGFDFTYNFDDQIIYWLEHDWSNSGLTINKIKFDGEQRSQLSADQSQSFGYIYCLDFDTSSRNIFLGNIQESQIEVVNADNFHRAVIFSGSVHQLGVGQPISIAVNSEDHEVYWIDRGFDSVPMKIAAVKMDGSSSRILMIWRTVEQQ